MDKDNKYEALRLKNQLCFPLYAAAKEVVRKYNPLLNEIDLTYTQYITMMVLWEVQEISVKELGEHLYLDSGTLTPLLKALEKKGFVTRSRSETDERVLIVKVSESGMALRDKAADIPSEIGKCFELEPDEAAVLYKILYKILDTDRE